MYFEFKGKTAAQMGMLLLDMPSIASPAERGESVTVPMRHGDVWMSEGAYDPVRTTLSFWLMPSGDEEKVRAWLSGSGSMRFTRDDYYYRMRIEGECIFKPLRGDGYQVSVPAVLSPFRVNEDAPGIVLTQSGTFAGQGSMEAKPLITVYGSGMVEITINGTVFGFDALPANGTVIDCEKEECRMDGQTVSAAMQGEYPVLLPGMNDIVLGGGCTQVSIAPKWRKRVSGKVSE